MKFFNLCSLLVILLFSGARRPIVTDASSSIEGVVVNTNSQPVSQVHVYIVKGEEESITSNNGKFVLTTWQSFPVSVSVEHPEYKKIKVVIKDTREKQLIRLEPR